MTGKERRIELKHARPRETELQQLGKLRSVLHQRQIAFGNASIQNSIREGSGSRSQFQNGSVDAEISAVISRTSAPPEGTTAAT
jgi:hypothetical protein